VLVLVLLVACCHTLAVESLIPPFSAISLAAMQAPSTVQIVSCLGNCTSGGKKHLLSYIYFLYY
jgi:hypothetical protein